MIKQKIIFLKGLPASGKTTWAKQHCLDNIQFKRINKDDVREGLGNLEWSRAFEKEVLKIQREKGVKYLESGFSLIVDDTNFSSRHFDFWEQKAAEYTCDFEERYFDIPVEECIQRDEKREKTVGKEVIMRMYKRYAQHNKNLITHSRFILEQDEKLPHCIICDLDGTIALIKNRSPFSTNVINDDPFISVIKILERYHHSGTRIIFFSGRSEDSRPNTEKWMEKHLEFYNESHSPKMRKSGDYRSDDIIKTELYEEFIKDKYFVEFVLDDRDSVVKAWRDLGLLCLQVYYGNF